MGRDEPLLAFLPSWYLWDSCSSGRRGTAAPLCPPNPDWNADMLSFFHSGSLPEQWLWPWFDFSEGWGKRLLSWLWLSWEGCLVPVHFQRKSQDECSQPTQTCDLGSSEPVERWGLGHLLFGVSVHGGLSTTIHGCLLWQKQGDPEGYGASLALCSPASGGVSLTCPMGGPYKQCWKHLISCLPRRFPPGESDSDNLVKSWVSQRKQLGWGNVDGKAWARGIWRFKLTLGPKLWSQEFMYNRAVILSFP